VSLPATDVTMVSGSDQLPTLRRLPLPVSEPAAAQRVELEPPDHPVAPDQYRLTLALPTGPPPRPRTLLIETEPVRPEQRRPRPDPDADLPDPQLWVAKFVQAAVEVAAGVRQPSQLVRWTSLDVHAMLVRRAALAARFDRVSSTRRRAVVRTVMVCRPAPAVCEASAVVAERGGRVRAVALRVEGLDGRWRVTALRIG
jgi:hypothetical protein